jgi:hypothetical protein
MPVGSFGVREFGPDDLRLLSAVGGMLGLAIDNERLAEQSRRHLAEVRMLWEIDRALGEDQPLDHVLGLLAREAAQFCGGDTAVILVEGEEAQVAAAHGSRALHAMGHPPALGGQQLAALLRDTQPHLRRVETADGRWHAALVGVHAPQRQVGLLVVRPSDWDEPELGPLATLAQRAALAVGGRAREAEGRRSAQLALLSAAPGSPPPRSTCTGC